MCLRQFGFQPHLYARQEHLLSEKILIREIP